MSKLAELQELIERQMSERLPDLPIELLASEDGWARVLKEIEPGTSVEGRRAGPMIFDGITVVIDPGLPAGEFRLRFLSDLHQ